VVVWLDELQRYLDHPGGLPVGVLRRLATAGVVVVATLWPEEYGSRTMPGIPGQPDRYGNDRELLGLAHVVTVPEALSQHERRRAEDLAADPRIRLALDTPDAGFTQVLAAGPALVNHWENAPANQCYGKAVITAALDARRVGTTASLTREFLAAAAPAFLTPVQQAGAPGDWLDRALAYATRPLHGAASALAPVPTGKGRIAGYTVAEYLHQHAQRVRRTTALPDRVWQALLDHHHPDDTARLAVNADRRGRPNEAIALYRLNTGDESAAYRLAELLTKQGHIDEAITVLRARADAGASYLAELLAEHGHVDELRAHANAGDEAAADRLAELLTAHGRVDELAAEVAAGTLTAAGELQRIIGQRSGPQRHHRSEAIQPTTGNESGEVQL
jgi:hypothetical protein